MRNDGNRLDQSPRDRQSSGKVFERAIRVGFDPGASAQCRTMRGSRRSAPLPFEREDDRRVRGWRARSFVPEQIG